MKVYLTEYQPFFEKSAIIAGDAKETMTELSGKDRQKHSGRSGSTTGTNQADHRLPSEDRCLISCDSF